MPGSPRRGELDLTRTGWDADPRPLLPKRKSPSLAPSHCRVRFPARLEPTPGHSNVRADVGLLKGPEEARLLRHQETQHSMERLGTT
jgi:hypothetical protein